MSKGYFALAAASMLLASCGSNSDPVADDPDVAATDEIAATDPAPTVDGDTDALVAGTEYNATTIMKCGFDGKLDQDCNAGVKRNWGEEPGGALVEVTKPDGRTRAIFFRGLEAYGADSAQADGSAGWDFKATRNGDVTTIEYGPERYEIVDALIEGG